MNFREEALKIFENHCTAPTRESHLRHLFRVIGDGPGTPVHETVCGLFKKNLPEEVMESRLKSLVGTQIKPEVSREVKALADEIRAELGLTKVDPEEAEKAVLAMAYPSLVGPEPEPYDPLEGLNTGQREICESFYGSGETLSFGHVDGYVPEPVDKELEEQALGFYPKMK
jgi:hypothetical protein